MGAVVLVSSMRAVSSFVLMFEFRPLSSNVAKKKKSPKGHNYAITRHLPAKNFADGVKDLWLYNNNNNENKETKSHQPRSYEPRKSTTLPTEL